MPAPRAPISRRTVVGGLGGGLLASLSGVACRAGSVGAESDPTAAGMARQVRAVREIVDAQTTIEGAGVKLRRSIGSRALPLLDPFLLLDEIHSDQPKDYIAGFPRHPHRGFETVTYMLNGAMEHQDSLGNHGHLGPGSAQWMTAGHGIIHSEMPLHEDSMLWGFQLWVNLPAAQKMIRPRYQDLAPERIRELSVDDASVRLVAGEVKGVRGPVEDIVTAPEMLDVRLPARGSFSHPVPVGHNAFAYVFDGQARVGSARAVVKAGQLAVLGPGGVFSARSDEGARMLLLAGKPIGEPVARYGPFVMNTDAEIQTAIEDYRTGRLLGS